MSAPFFFKRSGGLALREIASLVGGEPREGADLDRRISGIAPLDRAAPSELSFLDSPKYVQQAATTVAGACLTSQRFIDALPSRVNVITVREPYRGFVEVARALFPDSLRPSSLFEASGAAAGAYHPGALHPGSHVHPSARLENGVTVDPGAVIGAGAEIGSGTVIGAGAAIGVKVRIGRDCAIGPNATIMHALIGDRVIIHPGCAIGQDGFGFVRGPRGAHKVPQVGRVIIQDDVEIGANCAVDRGAIRDTVIGEGSKIDNLVQIAHNVSIGRHCLLAGQSGVSGSSTIEDGVIMGGKAGVSDHLTVGAGAMLGAKAGVFTDVPAGARWSGYPARSGKQWLREVVTLERLARESRGGRAQDDE
jgi:UDP-3-O-[3-hydroxymyristoyl] glucosamine N-acyltransferase